MQWKMEDALKYAGSAALISSTEKKEKGETQEQAKASKYQGKTF